MKDTLASYGRSHLEASFSFEGVPSLVVNGDIAQLGERLNGIQEVSGSIPLISTKLKNALSLLSAEVLFIFPAEYISVFCILRHDSCGF